MASPEALHGRMLFSARAHPLTVPAPPSPAYQFISLQVTQGKNFLPPFIEKSPGSRR